MITRRFIKDIHDAFDELNYHETKTLDLASFEESAVATLTHCETLEDAIHATKIYRYVLKNWYKIETIFEKKLKRWNKYAYEGNVLLSLVSDEEAVGTYFITNGINAKVEDVFVSSQSFGSEMYKFGHNNGRFTCYDPANFSIQYSDVLSAVIDIHDINDACVCNLVLDTELGIFLSNNQTKYHLAEYDNFIGIYEKSYIDSLSEDDVVDMDHLIADIEWDILNKHSDLGLAKLNVYEEGQDLELLLLFAASTFLVFQRDMLNRQARIDDLNDIYSKL